MKSSLEIAQEAVLKPMDEIAVTIGLTKDDIEYYGKNIAKISLTPERKKEIFSRPLGKYILVTATSPTPAGEGKTTTSIGLTQGLSRIGKKAVVTLRQPSLGPVFGIKGGAAGAGYSQVLPMEEINLGLAGDFSKVESAHNLLSALLDNHLLRGNKLNIDLTTIQWRRAMDMNDRALRNMATGLGEPSINGVARFTGFDITAASEIMAVLALAKDLPDLKERLGRLVVARDKDGKVVTAADLKANGAMAALMKSAVKPNLVQTTEGQACIMHSGPFGNIAHGCSSIIGDEIALHLADYVVTEAGFGSDLGAEKFFDIKCRQSGQYADAAVLVTTIKALKMHGGLPYDKELLKQENFEALEKGSANLLKHIENMKSFGVPLIVVLNKFPTDTDAEIKKIEEIVAQTNADGFALSEGVVKGSEGTEDLARKVVELIENREKPVPNFVYADEDAPEEKMKKIAQKIYGAADIVIPPKVMKKLDKLKEDGYSKLPICIAKTHLSLTEDPTIRGAPKDFIINFEDVRISAGAGFIYPIAGKMLTMPGLPPVPSAEVIDIDEDGTIIGLF